jgi:hypothetical protein
MNWDSQQILDKSVLITNIKQEKDKKATKIIKDAWAILKKYINHSLKKMFEPPSYPHNLPYRIFARHYPSIVLGCLWVLSGSFWDLAHTMYFDWYCLDCILIDIMGDKIFGVD